MDAQRGIARRMVIGLPADGLSPAWEKDFSQYSPAGVILFARDFRDLEDLRRITRRLRELARPRRLFVAMDEEGGWVTQLGGHLPVPPNAALLMRGAAPGDLGWIAEVTGRRLRALGVDWDFAPVADVNSEPDNPVIGPRAYSSDPATVAAAVGEVVGGLRGAGVASCLKHFPGHGDTRVDSHVALPTSAADAATLERRELVPFRANLDADSVMTAHVVYPALDPDRPGTYSSPIVRTLLRERLGFRGVCVTDALEMRGAAAGRTPAEAGKLALEAGCDLLLYAFHGEDVRRARLELAKALVDGALDRANFDAARSRLSAFDRRHATPTAEETSAPLDSLTPHDWASRLEGIASRGLIVRGAPPASAAATAWRVSEPGFAHGRTMREELAAAGLPVDAGAAPRAQVLVVCSRLPLGHVEIAALQNRCGELPTVLVGLQNDAFLERVPDAAMTISASDATPLTRRVVARRLVEVLRAAQA